MKTKLLLTLTALLTLADVARSQGTAFTCQGRLNNGTNAASGSYDMTFALFDASSGGTQQGGLSAIFAIPVSNGLFAVTLDLGNNFPGSDRWLEIAVRTNGGGSFSALSPRQALTATPYAITAGNLTGPLPAAQLSGTIVSGNLPASPNFSGTVTANSIAGNGANVTNVNAATLNGLTAANFWLTNGNAGANPTNGAFLGTTDFLPLEFRVGNQRALRIEPKNKSPGFTNPTAPIIVLGYSGNVVSNSSFGATILGGGDPSGPNTVSGSWGTVVGGSGNTAGQNAIAMGNHSTASGAYSVAIGDQALASVSDSFALGHLVAATNGGAVALGYGTLAGGAASTAMGDHSRASGQASTAMGLNTIASGAYATATGAGTRATNDYATSMGSVTLAGGVASTAMGYNAQAIHDGTFVWSDRSPTYAFSSTSSNQFLVLATGGVGINTNNPGPAALNVNGTVVATSFIGDGSGLTGLPSGGSNGPVTLAQLPAAVVTNGASGVTLSGSFTGNGSGLSSLNAGNLSSGTVADARLSANVDLLNANQTLTGAKAFSAELAANNSIRLNGSNVWLLGGIDINHGLGYYGNSKPFGGTTPDGPVLFGYGGGELGSSSGGYHPVLTWTPSAVGIGTTTPVTALHVYNSAQILATFENANSGGTWVNLANTSPGGHTWNLISSASGNGEGPGKLLFRDGAQGVLMTLSTNGNVGIGTVNPQATLDVNGNVQVAGQLKITGGSPGQGKILVSDTNGLASWQSPSALSVFFGQHYSVLFPDVIDNTVELEIAGITGNPSPRVVMVNGPGLQIQRVLGFNGTNHADQPGPNMEFPIVFSIAAPTPTALPSGSKIFRMG